MYLNLVSFKNGRTLHFRTETPYSAEKTATEWTIVTDAQTGQTFSFRGSEVVTIATAKESAATKKNNKKPGLKTSVVSE
jgi:hypothetical protein